MVSLSFSVHMTAGEYVLIISDDEGKLTCCSGSRDADDIGRN
jgi:hypothetical protein